MPRFGCDTHIEKPSMDIVDRVFDLRNRVMWLKNVEYCLLGDQNDRLAKVKAERYEMEMFNNDLRKKLKTFPEKIIINRFEKPMTIVNGIEYMNDKRNRIMQEHNQLIFIERCLLDQIESLHNETDNKSIPIHIKQIRVTNIIKRRIREIQDRLTSVKLINKTLSNCKQYLQCDLNLLRKELPNVQRDIGQKFHQRIILKKEFTDIVAENKRRLEAYQQLLDHTEAQTQQRRTIHEQAMASVAEQLESQYQIQMTTANVMTTSFETRKLIDGSSPTKNLKQKKLTMMNSDEIVQVHCMYDQFYNMIMAGIPIDITNSEQLKTATNEVVARTTAMLTMTNRMMEEKEQLIKQINRTDKLLKLIEMSIDLKNDTRHHILETMIEQRQNLELFYMNDTVEEQNRILRQINDFIIVLSKILCEHVGAQFVIEPPIDFIERLKYIFDLVSKTVKNVSKELTDDDDRQTTSTIRRSGGEENSQRNSQTLQETRSIDRSITSSLS